MSPEESAKIKVGDHVLVECEVAAIEARPIGPGYMLTLRSVDDAPDTMIVFNDAIHSVLPRPLQVGDTVLDVNGVLWEITSPPRRTDEGCEEVGVWNAAGGYTGRSVEFLTREES